ncbi:MAG: calcium/sodium antiporter [Candidatus Altiarchaeales archaeon]|nr:calcium/sodium antiporter [Candidatus Altiarchaeales archaeon]MBD3416383.1 calcium/sodium antiporter [Candidatus Altiarchaeales archaeon]
MLDLLLWVVVFASSLFVLVKSSEHFTDAAEKIGLFYGVPAFIVGVTIVSVGTSLPEMVSSVIAVLNGSSEIVSGTVVGSNIANIFLILGIVAILAKKMDVTFEVIHVDLPIFAASAFLLALMSYDGVFTRPEAFLSLAGALIYVGYTFAVEKRKKSPEVKELEKEAKKVRITQFTWVTLALSALFIYVGAKYTIESVVVLSEFLGIGKGVLAASAIALGTCLPELTVSCTAARKGKAELALGNILGSNIFNSFLVMGVSGLFGTLAIAESMLALGIPLMLVATVLAFFIVQDKQVTMWEGWMLTLFYVFFMGKLLGLI